MNSDRRIELFNRYTNEAMVILNFIFLLIILFSSSSQHSQSFSSFFLILLSTSKLIKSKNIKVVIKNR